MTIISYYPESIERKPMRLSDLASGTYTCTVGTARERTLLIVTRHGAVGIDSETEYGSQRSWVRTVEHNKPSFDWDATELYDVQAVTVDSVNVTVNGNLNQSKF